MDNGKNSKANNLLEKMAEFKKAFGNLVDAINEDSEFDVLIADEYPFNLSFDELYLKVIEWEDRVIENVVKDYFKE